jgi:hypothetical protein
VRESFDVIEQALGGEHVGQPPVAATPSEVAPGVPKPLRWIGRVAPVQSPAATQ